MILLFLLLTLSLPAQDFTEPLLDGMVTSKVGYRENVTGGEDLLIHRGVDYFPLGKEKGIFATESGQVVTHFPPPGRGYRGHPVFGALIIIYHGKGIYSLYGHMSKTYIKEGQFVEKGQKIGLVGSSGRSTGVHLHFEIIHDPSYLLGFAELKRDRIYWLRMSFKES